MFEFIAIFVVSLVFFSIFVIADASLIKNNRINVNSANKNILSKLNTNISQLFALNSQINDDLNEYKLKRSISSAKYAQKNEIFPHNQQTTPNMQNSNRRPLPKKTKNSGIRTLCFPLLVVASISWIAFIVSYPLYHFLSNSLLITSLTMSVLFLISRLIVSSQSANIAKKSSSTNSQNSLKHNHKNLNKHNSSPKKNVKKANTNTANNKNGISKKLKSIKLDTNIVKTEAMYGVQNRIKKDIVIPNSAYSANGTNNYQAKNTHQSNNSKTHESRKNNTKSLLAQIESSKLIKNSRTYSTTKPKHNLDDDLVVNG